MALPTLHLSEIPDDGLSWASEVRPEELALGPEDARAPGGLTLSVKAVKADTSVRVTGRLTGVLLRQCVRCLKDYEEALSLPAFGEYRRDQAPRGQAADDPDDEDVYVYTGEDIDLGEMLREQIILAAPMQPLCSETCRGLCPVCGQDLNVRRCGCPEARQESPFAVLRELRDAVGRRTGTRARRRGVKPRTGRTKKMK